MTTVRATSIWNTCWAYETMLEEDILVPKRAGVGTLYEVCFMMFYCNFNSCILLVKIIWTVRKCTILITWYIVPSYWMYHELLIILDFETLYEICSDCNLSKIPDWNISVFRNFHMDKSRHKLFFYFLFFLHIWTTSFKPRILLQSKNIIFTGMRGDS
jgi:hypothetical protein